MDAKARETARALLMWVSHAVGGANAGLNGTEFRAGEIARTWDRPGWRLCILYSRKGRLDPLFSRLHAEGRIEYRPYDSAGRLGYARAILAAARAVRPDLIHMQGPILFDFLAAVAARANGAKLIVTRTSNISEYNVPAARRLLFRALDRFVCRAANGRMQISDHGRRLWAEEIGVPQESIAVVRNGVDLASFSAIASPAPGRGETIFGCIAQLKWEKGFAHLLGAAAELKRRGLRFRILVAGDGPERAAIEARSASLGLDGEVRFEGYCFDIPGFLGRVDCLVLASLREGVPVSLIQAAAAGRPVVASRVGGIPEIVLDGETGLLVPARDAGTLAEAMAGLLLDPARRAVLGEAARRHSAGFSLERMVGEYCRIYDTLAGGGT